jgi:hypothetical protein
MSDATPSFITLRGFHDAGEGIAFAVAELDLGRFWVLARRGRRPFSTPAR